MVRIAKGEPDTTKLSSGVAHTEGETRNLGELFREKIKGQPVKRTPTPYTERSLKHAGKGGTRVSGILGVSKVNNRWYTQGYAYRYTFIKENGKVSTLQRKSMMKLHDAMMKDGHQFLIADIKKARNFIDKECNDEDYKFFFNKYIVERD